MAQALEPSTIMSDDEALGWTVNQTRNGPLNTTARELARAFGWPDDERHRVRVGRRLAAWEERGLINRETRPGGRQTITVGTVNNTVNNTVNIAVVQPVQATIAAEIPVIIPRSPVSIPSRFSVHRAIALSLALLGAYIAWNDLAIAMEVGHSWGRTQEAAVLFANVAWAVTAAGLVLPTAAAALWRAGHTVVGLVAWTAYTAIILPMAVLSAVAFVSANLSDTQAERAKTASESATLTQQIDRLTKERAAFKETRAVAAIEAEIQAAQGTVGGYLSRTSGCRDVTQAKSAEACAPLLRLRQAQEEARRRDAVDADLKDKQAALAGLPAVSSADPQAEAAAGLVTWISLRLVAPAASDFAMVRLLLFAMVLLMPGVLEMFAMSLWDLGTREKKL